jgi:hypothetical protein
LDGLSIPSENSEKFKTTKNGYRIIKSMGFPWKMQTTKSWISALNSGMADTVGR